MRRISAPATLCFALCCAPARAQAVAPNFTVSPASVAPGKPVTFAFRANGSGRVRARVDLLAPGKPPCGRSSALIRAGRALDRLDAAVLAAGPTRLGWWSPRTLTEYERAPLRSSSPPADGVFPVQGPYDFGGPDSRFGAQRTGHIHQGQDVAPAEGTPSSRPRGHRHCVAFQAAGAGNYVVIQRRRRRDYVFMHLRTDRRWSPRAHAVTAGAADRGGRHTGDAEGPHLHFEIWPDGW